MQNQLNKTQNNNKSSHTIFFKGQHSIITSPKNTDRADTLYKETAKAMTTYGQKISYIETTSKIPFEKLIPENTNYLVAHSAGAHFLFNSFKATQSEILKSIKGIILLDPGISLSYLILTNHPPIITFLSTGFMDRNWDMYGQVFRFNDNHFFTNSYDLITREIKTFLSTT